MSYSGEAHSHSYVQEDEEQEEEFGDRRSERRRGNKYARSEEGSVVRASTVEEVERANRAAQAHSFPVPRFVVRSGVEN